MPLDPALFRKEGGAIDELKKSQRARFQPEALIDEITELDAQWRAAQNAMEVKRAEVNKKSKEVGAAMKAKTDASKTIAEVKEIKEEIKKLEEKAETLQKARDAKINTVGNIVHSSVVVSKDEAQNPVVRTFGECKKPLEGKERHHHELLHMIDGYDCDRATPMAGHRAFFLKGVGVLLNQALINYGLSFLIKKNADAKEPKTWTALQPPFFMNESVMGETAQLSDFAETLYKVSGEEGEENKYLIATSEQPISAFHRHEHIEPEQLPLRYCGLSTCFRKEAGAHGKDSWGIFRIHQFEKVEQFCITTPEGKASWDMHEEMIKNCEEFYQSLKLPYRLVNIISGELNNAAAKKYDLEAWFPTLGVFRELVSASNCTDYQSRAMQTKFGANTKTESGRVAYVHMLNATLCATERTICCILENYQTADGVKVPDVLVPFMGGITFMPFKKPPPVNKQAEQNKKAAAAKKGGEKDQKDGAPAAGAGADAGKKDKGADKKEKADKKKDAGAAPAAGAGDKKQKEKKPKADKKKDAKKDG